jgi:hypothetical protein
MERQKGQTDDGLEWSAAHVGQTGWWQHSERRRESTDVSELQKRQRVLSDMIK